MAKKRSYIRVFRDKKKLEEMLEVGKSYKELLEIENEKRKKAGLWLYKPSKKGL